ncbi:MAG: hypothetical protein Q7U39_17740 [Nitrospira sp.]|nr:hypothetical protein [Nitrospira sp.]
MGKSKEPLTFFCIHDADGPGTKIYEALQEGTSARRGRDVRIVNLGLDPQEAQAMHLEVETFQRQSKVPVASYLSNEEKEWLQKHRIELNAMDTPTFVTWLDSKLRSHHNGKVIPPVDVLMRRLRNTIQETLKEGIRIRLLEQAGFSDHVRLALQSIDPDIAAQMPGLSDRIAAVLNDKDKQKEHWVKPLDRVAEQLVRDFLSRSSRNN